MHFSLLETGHTSANNTPKIALVNVSSFVVKSGLVKKAKVETAKITRVCIYLIE